MKRDYYEMIFKRKSFHLFRGVGNAAITQDELENIERAYADFDCLYPDIRTAIRIVPASKVNFKRDAEYCILIYSEEKDNYLMNAGYIGEQLDLYLTEHHIGSLWFGIGKPDEPEYRRVWCIGIHEIESVRSQYDPAGSKTRRKHRCHGPEVGII